MTQKSREFEQREVAFENSIAERYDRDYFQPRILKRHAEDFARFVRDHYRPGDCVLDLGCGPGSLWELWQARLPKPGALIGVDISPGMIDQARRRHPRGDFRVASVLELPLDTASIDLVIASSVLHHVPDDVLVDALKEIDRVLTDHGTLVGREPVASGRLADEESWFSGAIMGFHHLASRLTHAREYGEPPNGPHHHAYDPQTFVTLLGQVFTPRGVQSRHPFSYYVARSDHPLVERMALWFDRWLDHRPGQEFYYAAVKNYVDASDVSGWIAKELEQKPTYDRQQFMALLIEAANMLERDIGGDASRRRRWWRR